jgi:hypothetical protein
MQISQKAIALIVREEVSSKAYYERHYVHPEWPGGASGVTVGIGYDLGYATAAKIKADFGALVDPGSLAAMVECAGVKGAAAQGLCARVRSRITVSWDAGYSVFMNRDIPSWIAATARALPNCALLSPTCLGVLTSLDYNRGTGGYSAAGDRYLEMRQIKAAMASKDFAAIPGYLDHMARLWSSGVAGRRHREAALFREGLKESVSTTPAPVPPPPDPDVIGSSKPDQPARTKPPATTPAQHGSAGAIIVGTQAGAHWLGFSGSNLVLLTVASIVIAGGVWFAWYRNRNPD